MSNLRALLNHEVLLSTYDQGAVGVQTPLTDRFLQNPMSLDTDEAAFLIRPNTRTAAPFNKRGAPARQLGLEGKSKKSGAMFHVFNSFKLSPEVFQGLREPDSPSIQRKAKAEIADQMDTFARQHQIQKELAFAKFMCNGVVYVDQATGQIVESSGATVETVDFGVATSHQDTTYSLPFDDAATDIEKMLENIRIQAEAESAPPPTLAIANSTLKRYIRLNTNFRTFAAYHDIGQQVMLYGEFVEGLFGINWLFIDKTYTDSSGTTRKYIPDQKLVLCPGEDTSWLQPVQGLEMVPTSIDIGPGDAVQLANSLSEVYGKFSYGQVSHNPPSLDMYAGDNFGWILREPNALWQFDVIYS